MFSLILGFQKRISNEALGSASNYYKLFVEVNEKGKVVYGSGDNAKTITGATQTFDVKEQENIVLTLTANEGYKLDKVTVNGMDKTSDVTSDGKLTITGVNGNQTVKVEFAFAGLSIDVAIGAEGAATFCSSEALDFSGTDDVKAYIVSAFNPSTGTVTLTRITDVPAGTGIVVLGDEGTYDIPLGAGETYVMNMLVGTLAAKTLSKTEGANTNFILADGENGLGFYAVANGSMQARPISPCRRPPCPRMPRPSASASATARRAFVQWKRKSRTTRLAHGSPSTDAVSTPSPPRAASTS